MAPSCYGSRRADFPGDLSILQQERAYEKNVEVSVQETTKN